MVRRGFTTVSAIFSRDIFTITGPETNGDACSGVLALRRGRKMEKEREYGAKEIGDERRVKEATTRGGGEWNENRFYFIR